MTNIEHFVLAELFEFSCGQHIVFYVNFITLTVVSVSYMNYHV